MSEKALNSPLFHRIITIILFAGLVGVYDLVYVSHKRDQYNPITFGFLREITNNFNNHVGNYGLGSSYEYVRNNTLVRRVKVDRDSTHPVSTQTFQNALTGKAKEIEAFHSNQGIENNTIIYKIEKAERLVYNKRQALHDILDHLCRRMLPQQMSG